MKSQLNYIYKISILIVAVSCSIGNVLADDVLKAVSATPSTAVTVSDPKIPIEELKLLIKPLTKDELGVEAEAWMKVLKEKVNEISQVELLAQRKTREIAKTSDAADSLREAREKVKEAKEKSQEATQATGDKTDSAAAYVEATEAAADAQKNMQEAQKNMTEAEALNVTNKNDKDTQKTLQRINEKRQTEAADGTKSTEQNASDKATDKAVDKAAAVEGVKAQKIVADASKKPVTAVDSTKLETAANKADQLVEQKTEAKKNILTNLTVLKEEQIALIDRFHVVTEELVAKGGTVDDYTKYVTAISGLNVDISDGQALWIASTGWVMSKEGGLRWLMNLATFLGCFGFFWLVAHWLTKLANHSLSLVSSVSSLMRSFLLKVIYRGILIIGVLVGLTALEVSLGPLFALFGGISFILAFALQNNLSNFASGLMILFYKPFDIGDEIKAAGLGGIVDSITLAHTKLKGATGESITIPNGAVWGGVITNLTYAKRRKLNLPIHVNHNQDFAKVKELLTKAVAAHPKIFKDPAPAVFISKVQDYYVEILAGGWTETDNYRDVYQEVLCLIQAKLHEEGIGFAIPTNEGIFK